MSNNKQQTEMNKEFIPYELALELKQLGFAEPCLGYYLASSLFISNDNVYNSTDIPVIKAPLYSQAFRWFREKHLLEGLVLPQDKSVPDPLPIYFIAVISYEGGEMNELFNSTSPINMLHYSEYGEAELVCLREMIKLVKK